MLPRQTEQTPPRIRAVVRRPPRPSGPLPNLTFLSSQHATPAILLTNSWCDIAPFIVSDGPAKRDATHPTTLWRTYHLGGHVAP